ncbi:DUF4190 domain-containing protein [Xanthomonas medicagonis]|uniref:DUF4190 domain-containing protein n=1 Tax=Xanthomonas medicagonis TaxID=3160841 RepID=UPI003518E748
MSTVRETNSLAVVSLVAGVLGWTVMPVLGSLCAIITGHLARAQIRRQPQRFRGDELALGGLVLGWAMVVFAVLAALALLGFIIFFGNLIYTSAHP